MNRPGSHTNNFRKPMLKVTIRPRLVMLQKIVLFASAVLVLASIGGTVFYFQFGNIEMIKAAALGDYRSKTTGHWNSTSTWEKYDGTNWVAALATPTNTDGAITIQNGHTVTVSVSVTADMVVVDAGGSLTISSGKTLTIASGVGTDLDMNGTLTINGTLAANASTSTLIGGNAMLAIGGSNTFGAGATIAIQNGARYRADDKDMTTASGVWIVNNGGVFQQNFDGGNIPLATWNTGSAIELTGVIGSIPGNFNQPFYHLTYNSPNQTTTEKLSGELTTVNGNLNFISSGTGTIRISQQENYTLTIGGDLNVQGGKLALTCKAPILVVNVSGNIVQTGGTFLGTDVITEGGSGNPVINVTGDFTVSGGTFDMNQNSCNSVGKGITTMNLNGNFSQTGGTITETANTSATYGYGIINFSKTGTQLFSRSGSTISNTIHFTVDSNSVLDMGTSYPTGNGSFTLSGGGGLIMGSLQGITLSASNGNVQVSGTRSFSAGADYTYNGSAAQNTGDGLPATVYNLTVNNSSEISLSNNVAVTNTLTLTAGKIITGSKEVSVTNASEYSVTGHSAKNYIHGKLRRSINSSGSYDFPVGTADKYELIVCQPASLSGVSNLLCSFTSGSCGNVTPGLVNHGMEISHALNIGYWSLDPNANPTGGSYGITIYAKGVVGELSSNPDDYAVLHRHGSGNNWALNGEEDFNRNEIIGSLTSGQIKAARTGLTTFSDYTGGSGGGMFPIQLIYFNAKTIDDRVDLSWLTGTEINNDCFTIERSADGRTFESLFTIPGAGNSTEPLHYSATDDHPLNGYSYYRLKQTNYDGRFSYSQIKTVKYKGALSEATIEIISVAPNPFSNRFLLTFSSKVANGMVNLSLVNSSGQILIHELLQANDGINQYEFTDQLGMPTGIYFIHLVRNEERITQKIIKKE